MQEPFGHLVLMTPDDAAKYLQLSASYLRNLRLTGEGPQFHRLGYRVVRYALADLEAWVRSRARSSTSDPGPPEGERSESAHAA
jgi:hypothetical protein